MKGTDFKRWATRGCRIYGEDPWFFIRELAQNARDAGADRVEISTWWTERGHEVFRFTDDGTGMSSDHARQFLFRLYASSKDDERDAAGEYGIGFWAVLRYNPIRTPEPMRKVGPLNSTNSSTSARADVNSTRLEHA